MREYKIPEPVYWTRIREDLNWSNPSPEFLRRLKKLGPNKLKQKKEILHIEIKPSSKK
jgi:hypothetical protein